MDMTNRLMNGNFLFEGHEFSLNFQGLQLEFPDVFFSF